MAGTLYIVATPIGNLKDTTLRAIETFHKVDLILAEDTRVTKKLLSHYNIDRPILSYHQHSSPKKKERIFMELKHGRNLGLVTDAGTPGLSDPGNELIDYLLNRDSSINIVPIPGPAAITTAISISGLKMSKFLFIGFLPKKKRNKLFEWIKIGKMSFAFYESPKRISKTLDVLIENFGGDKRVCICRELTKIYETIYRGTLKDVKARLEKENIKGEIVVLVE